MGIIYKISNDINNKIYIGQTRYSLSQRWNQHLYQAKNKKLDYPLYMAMRKYGIDKFHIKEIEQCPDQLLNEREKYWINYYNSYKQGYNATRGGEGHSIIDIEQVIKLYKQGFTQKQISEQLNYSLSAISRLLSTYVPELTKERNNQNRVHNLQNAKKEGRPIPILMFDKNYTKPQKYFRSLQEAALYLGKNKKILHILVKYVEEKEI